MLFAIMCSKNKIKGDYGALFFSFIHKIYQVMTQR